MLNYLQDVQGNTPISMLPSIINHNNQALNDEFAWIYDSETDRITRSVYAPTGSVKAHFGEFVNLSAEYITIKNTNSLLNSIKSAVETLPHNDMDKCWSSDTAKEAYTQDSEILLCHDASVIAYNDESVYQALARFDANLTTMNETLNTYLASTKVDEESYAVSLASVEDETVNTQTSASVMQYPSNYLTASLIQLKRKNLPKVHLNDLSNGKLYNYYTISNMSVNVNDDAYCAIDTKHTNIIIDVTFTNHSKNEFYTILLDRKEGTYVQMNKHYLNRLQLKAIEYSSEYGTKWSIYSYSVVNSDNIKLVNL